jgi:hypothetical protein
MIPKVNGMKKLILAIIVFSVILGLSACNFSLAQDITPPPGYETPVDWGSGTETAVATVEAEPTPTAGTEPESSSSFLAISGSVTNGSGVDITGPLTLTLYGYDNFDPVLEQTGTAAADGSYKFDGLDPVAGRLFFITVEYQGTIFASDFVTLQASQTEIDLPVVVYEVTHGASVLKAEHLNIFFEFNEPETVQVVQLWVISNPTNQAVAPKSQTEPVLLFSLPDGYSNLMFENGQLGQQYLKTESGFGDLLTVLPGEAVYQLLYTFQLPYQNNLNFAQTITMPTNLVQVFVPEGIKITANKMENAGVQNINGVSYNMLKRNQVADGSELSMSLKGRNPAKGSIFSIAGDRTNLLVGAVGLLMAVVGVTLWLRQARSAQRQPDYRSAEELMDVIIDLDSDFENGELTEDEYREQRAGLKARLAEMMANDDPEDSGP